MEEMKMTSMKGTDSVPETALAASSPEYPYGLKLDLNEDSLAKLGITDLPEVGSSVHVMANAEVYSVSMSEDKDGKERKSVCLQITDMALGDSVEQSKPKRSPSDTLYGTPEADNLIPVQTIE